eukprot:GDKJ01022845.1.p1 GENE.GDKJ01022845.1~~GDKJ01022845.1.p1  ORF type:complete len:377 (-),score=98.30 GDKJ01022845.1:1046-2140(-)
MNSIELDSSIVYTPIIGVLTQPFTAEGFSRLSLENQAIADKGHSQIPFSLIAWIRRSGGIPVAIPYDLPEDELLSLLSRVHAVVMPGGGQETTRTDVETMFMRTSRLIFEMSCQSGNDMPLFGICQGFQVLSILSASHPSVLSRHRMLHQSTLLQKPFCDLDPATPLDTLQKQVQQLQQDFIQDEETLLANYSTMNFKSVLFSRMPERVKKSFFTRPSLPNSHSWGVSLEDFIAKGVFKKFKLVGIDHDDKGSAIVGMMEHREHSIFGVQFHPEVDPNVYSEEFLKTGIVDAEVQEAGEWLGRFLVGLGSMSSRRRWQKGELCEWEVSEEETLHLKTQHDGYFVIGARREHPEGRGSEMGVTVE